MDIKKKVQAMIEKKNEELLGLEAQLDRLDDQGRCDYHLLKRIQELRQEVDSLQKFTQPQKLKELKIVNC